MMDLHHMRIYRIRWRWVWLGWIERIKDHFAFRLGTYRLNELLLNILMMPLRTLYDH